MVRESKDWEQNFAKLETVAHVPTRVLVVVVVGNPTMLLQNFLVVAGRIAVVDLDFVVSFAVQSCADAFALAVPTIVFAAVVATALFATVACVVDEVVRNN